MRSWFAARAWPARLLFALFILLCGVWYGKRCWLDQMPDHGPSDFQFYYLAAQHVLHGRSPYLEGGYVYPPLLACLLAPLAVFDYFTARWIWFVLSHTALLAAGYILWKHLGRGRVALCCIALVWGAGGAAEDGFGLGQLDALLTLLAVVAITRAGSLSVLSVSAGFALKFFPGILALPDALERRWRALAATTGAGILLMLAPWAVVHFGLQGPPAPPRTEYLAGTPCLLSWSLPSVALRLMDRPGPAGTLPQDWVFGYDLPKLHLSAAERIASVAVAALTLLVGLLALRRRRITPANRPLAGAALLALALAASPISWWHYPVLQYPGIAMLLVAAVRLRRPGLFCGGLATAACLYLLPSGVLRFYFHQHERWPDYPWVITFWSAVPGVAALILFGLLLGRLRETRTAHVK